MRDLIGTTVHAYDLDGEELGDIHLPTPVLAGVVAVLEDGSAYEIVSGVFHNDVGTPFAATLRPVTPHPTRR